MPSKTKRSGAGLRQIQAEDLFRLQLISEPRLSPDGQHVIFALHGVDQKSLKKSANLWLAPAESSTLEQEARQFTFGEQADYHARWSPDGSQIAFLSNRGNKEKPAQIYLIPFGGGEARPLSHIEGEINDFAWSPDGRKLLCSIRKLDPEVLERDKDEQKKKLGVVARRYDRLFYKLDGYGYLPHERTHLWVIDAKTGRAKQITDDPVHDEMGASWSPDGKWIIFASNRLSEPDQNPDVIDLFVIPAAGGEMRKLETPLGDKSTPVFSPDGKWIAYYGTEGTGLWYKNTALWVMPADGSAPAGNLTDTYDLHTSSWTISDQTTPEQMPPTWAKDSQRIYFPACVHGSSILMSIDLSGKDLQTVIGEGAVVGSFSFNREQTRLAYFYANMTDPNQVRLRELSSGADRQLTQVNKELMEGIDLGNVEEVWFKGPDGNDLQGWIMTPPGFDPSKKYPSILEIHGGPLTQYGKYFMHEFYYLASKGFVVYFTNPRGGRGYGEKHAGGIWRAWGTTDYADLMAWTDLVAQKPYIDTERMGVTGGSYGGYMTVWIVGHTQRFKAAVTQRCVSNFISMWGSSDMNWVFEQEVSEKPPFADVLTYWDRSPIKYIGNCKTPMKVIHNENDLRCPIEQGEQVFVALKRLGVDTEMVRFPDEFHGLSRTGRTDRRIARLNHILGWFEKYLR